jgi:hypothetical protein
MSTRKVGSPAEAVQQKAKAKTKHDSGGISKPKTKAKDTVAQSEAGENNAKQPSKTATKAAAVKVDEMAMKKTTNKSRPKTVISGVCEFRKSIYNTDHTRSATEHRRVEDRQDFYANSPIPPAPTKNALSHCMRTYASNFCSISSQDSVPPASANDSDTKDGESTTKKQNEENMDVDGDGDGNGNGNSNVDGRSSSSSDHKKETQNKNHVNVSESAAALGIHALDVFLGSLFDFVHNAYGTPDLETGKCKLKDKMTVSMLLAAIKAQIHYDHIHPRLKGDIELILRSCNLLIDLTQNKELVIRAHGGREYYYRMESDIINQFKTHLKADLSAPLFQKKGLEAIYARHRITTASEHCNVILELISRVFVAEMVFFSVKHLQAESMVTITDKIAKNALRVLGFEC